MAKFNFIEKFADDVLEYVFEGAIDEDAKLPPHSDKKLKKITINLRKVSGINSIGIREWVQWVESLSAIPLIVLYECPKAIVFQMNMISGFVPGNCVVESIFVPHFCEKCEKEAEILVRVGQDIEMDASGVVAYDFKPAEVAKCSENPCEMEMDYNPESYMVFLKRIKPMDLPVLKTKNSV